MSRDHELTQVDPYSLGYKEGYRLGGCKAAMAQISQTPSSVRDLRIMYIPQGFEVIDTGVTEALRSMVRECIVAEADAMLETARLIKPDVVLVMNGLHVFPSAHLTHIDKLREIGIQTAVWFVDDPYFSDDTAFAALHYDYVFTHEASCVPFYQELGVNHVYYLPLGMSSSLFHPKQTSQEYQYDICFIGNGFWNRVSLIDHMAPFLVDKKVFIAGGSWDRLTNRKMLGSIIREGWIPPEDTVTYYNGAKLVINMHRPCDAGSDNRNGHHLMGKSINPRTYEISACGTMQITDIREDLSLYYQPGFDIETFDSVSQLQEKITYYLDHEQERQVIAWRGLKTTMTKHTFYHRLDRLLELMFV